MPDMCVELITVGCSILSVIIIAYSLNRDRDKDHTDDGKQAGSIAAEIEYIRRGVDDISDRLKRHDDLFLKLSERVTAVEESAKQAHLRINNMEDKINHGR